jgi:hypothetical protein
MLIPPTLALSLLLLPPAADRATLSALGAPTYAGRELAEIRLTVAAKCRPATRAAIHREWRFTSDNEVCWRAARILRRTGECPHCRGAGETWWGDPSRKNDLETCVRCGGVGFLSPESAAEQARLTRIAIGAAP